MIDQAFFTCPTAKIVYITWHFSQLTLAHEVLDVHERAHLDNRVVDLGRLILRTVSVLVQEVLPKLCGFKLDVRVSRNMKCSQGYKPERGPIALHVTMETFQGPSSS